MRPLSQVESSLASELPGLAIASRILRKNELHLRVKRDDVSRLAKMLRSTYATELVLMVANDRRNDRSLFEIHYLFANAQEDWFVHAKVDVPPEDLRIPSLAIFNYQASRFEREMHDMFGIETPDHPDPRPLVKHAFWPRDYFPLRKDAQAPEHFEDDGTPFPFKAVGGEGVYEIPVGPVHAGIIEPGHFRFSVVGETIIDLKTRLYFTHKGTEKLFEDRSPTEGVELAERIAGDTTIGHSLAYCQALESLAQIEVPARASYIRVILLEMERLCNHIADFGAIANDTGFAIAQFHCFRIRERLLRLNKQLTGNRLLRGGIVLGGVGHDLPANLALDMELDSILADFEEIVDITLNNTILRDRLEGTGQLTLRTALDHAVLGYVARASGIDEDARRDHPFAAYGELEFRVPVFASGDVYARTMMRVAEARESVNLIQQALIRSPSGPLVGPPRKMAAFEPAFGIVEGWRGAIIHWVMVDSEERLYRVKIKDPSFANWPALSFALLKNIVPDFPLINKSFNLSYSGNDL